MLTNSGWLGKETHGWDGNKIHIGDLVECAPNTPASFAGTARVKEISIAGTWVKVSHGAYRSMIIASGRVIRASKR